MDQQVRAVRVTGIGGTEVKADRKSLKKSLKKSRKTRKDKKARMKGRMSQSMAVDKKEVGKRKTGTVKFWKANKSKEGGYGFITQSDGGQDVYVHWKEIK